MSNNLRILHPLDGLVCSRRRATVSILYRMQGDDAIKADIEKTLKEFKQRFVAERQAEKTGAKA